MIEELIQQQSNKQIKSTPEILDLAKDEDQKRAEELFAMNAIHQVIDDYKEQQNELFGVNNPTLVYAPNFKEAFGTYYADLQKELPLWKQGKWVYYHGSQRLSIF
jgi:hypothetical protein